jgi:hypothetical protein
MTAEVGAKIWRGMHKGNKPCSPHNLAPVRVERAQGVRRDDARSAMKRAARFRLFPGDPATKTELRDRERGSGTQLNA